LIENRLRLELTPSEIILLRADEFVAAASALDTINMIGKFDLLHKPGKVQARGLSQMLFSAALLAAERMGQLRLEIGSPKGLFSFFSSPTAIAFAANNTNSWPEGSLENRIVQAVQGRGQLPVAQTVYEVLEYNDSRYFNLTPELVKEALAFRNLLIKEQNTQLLIVKTTRYHLPESTMQLVAAQPVEPVRQLIEDTRRNDARLWKLLQTAIEKGMEKRMDNSPSD
jgi:hypothetical protein